jgi:hypothetical protein
MSPASFAPCAGLTYPSTSLEPTEPQSRLLPGLMSTKQLTRKGANETMSDQFENEGTGTATARNEEEAHHDFTNPNVTKETKGFTPFRDWLVRQIQLKPLTLEHAGETWQVEDLTYDGELRLARGPSITMLEFAEPYITSLLRQILPA